MLLHALKKAIGAAVVATVAMGSAAFADYPEKPITLVIPFSAGGSQDLSSRDITSTISAHPGRAMIAQLSPGAGGQNTVLVLGEEYQALRDEQSMTCEDLVKTITNEPVRDRLGMHRGRSGQAEILFPCPTDLVLAAFWL